MLTFLVGPTVAGSLLTGLLSGRAVLRDLHSPVFLPVIFTADDKVFLLLMGVAVNILEDLGWTGFAIPGCGRTTVCLPLGSSSMCRRGLALPYVLGARQFLGRAPAGHLACAPVLLVAGLSGADGVDLQPDREPARGAARARESHSHKFHLHAFVDKALEWSSWPTRAPRAAITPQADGLKGRRRMSTSLWATILARQAHFGAPMSRGSNRPGRIQLHLA